MKTNRAEQLWVNSPMRYFVQYLETLYFRKHRRLPADARVVEIGCGKGEGARLIDRAFSPGRIDALDIDPEMIRLARRSQHDGRLKNVVFRVADAHSLPFDSESVDAVFNFGILHHLEEWQRGIAEIARILKPGGGFYFEEIYPDLYAGPILRHILLHPTENRFRSPDYRAELERRGLELLPGYKESRFAILAVAIKR